MADTVPLRTEIRAPVTTVVQVRTLEIALDAGSGAPAELPARVFGFTGRAAELAAVVRAALAGWPAVQVTGRPGTGKTAVATEAAHALREHYPDGQIVLDLHGYDGARLYTTTLAARQVLVVADDAASVAQVRDLVPPPGSFLLLTTRPTVDEPRAHRVHVGELADADAVALVCHARPAAPADRMRAVARCCGGLPLALRIVAARLALDPDLDPAALARELDRAPLDGLSLGDRAVRESFRISHDRLSDPAQLVFRRCAVLPLVHVGPGTAAALTDLDDATAEAALHELARAHLLDEAGPPGRFRLHDLLRRYAGELGTIDPAAAVTTARARVTHRYLAELAATPDVATAARWLAVEWDNLLVVAEVLAATGTPGLQDIADGIVSVHDLPTPWDGWSRIQEAALADAVRRDDLARGAHLRRRLGIAYREHGLHVAATSMLAAAERDFRRCADRVETAGTVVNSAEVLRDLRRDEEAAQRFTAAIDTLAADTGPAALETLGWAWHGLGDVRTGQRRTAEALACHRRSRACFARIDGSFGVAWALHGAGDALRARGRLAAAGAAYERALAIFETMGITTNAGWTEQNLGELLLERGDHAGAALRFRRAQATAVTRSDPHLQARALTGLGDAAAARGDHEAAAGCRAHARRVLGVAAASESGAAAPPAAVVRPPGNSS